MPAKGQREDLTGIRFGNLTVVGFAGQYKNGVSKWNCACDCGQSAVAGMGALKRGDTVSCGCHRRSLLRTHGLSGVPEYQIWAAMIQRCGNPSNSAYHNYGGRGVVVCSEWRESFARFLADMGERPGTEYSIDRIDNDGNYEPENCRWATNVEQSSNRRNNRRVTVNGETKTVSEWSREHDICVETIESRIVKLGWDPARAVTQKPRALKRGRRPRGDRAPCRAVDY